MSGFLRYSLGHNGNCDEYCQEHCAFDHLCHQIRCGDTFLVSITLGTALCYDPSSYKISSLLRGSHPNLVFLPELGWGFCQWVTLHNSSEKVCVSQKGRGYPNVLHFSRGGISTRRYFFVAFAARSCRAIVTTRSISSQGAGFPVQISNCRAACCTNISIPGII